MSDTVFKILRKSEWQHAEATGVFAGSAVDIADGFIHLSTGKQISETATKHFRGQMDLLVVAFHAADLGDQLKWEASRGNDLFPHHYGVLQTGQALWIEPAPLDKNGIPMLSKKVLTC